MSSTTLGLNCNGLRNSLISCKQLKTIKTGKTGKSRDLAERHIRYSPDLIVSQIYNPMNLATIICSQFQKYPNSLINAFVDDLAMFEYLYEFLPKDISVKVLNQIPFDNAIMIVEKHQSSAFVYDQVDPILYVIRYFSDSKIRDPTSRDPHCIDFNKSIIPKGSVLDFVLKCKNYISSNDFQNLVKLLC